MKKNKNNKTIKSNCEIGNKKNQEKKIQKKQNSGGEKRLKK